MKRVLIVEDQKMVRDNMADYINASDELRLREHYPMPPPPKFSVRKIMWI